MKWATLGCLGSLVALFSLSLVYAESALNNNTKPLDIRLFYSLHYAGEPLVSPDQTRIIFTEYYYDQDQNTDTAFVNLVDISTGIVKALTPNVVGESYTAVDWLDDSHIAYTYNGSIYSKPLQENASGSMVFTPPWQAGTISIRDSIITFISSVYPDSNLQQTSDRRAQEKKNATTSAQVYDNLWPRHWDSWMTLRKPNVFSAPLIRDEDKWSVGSEMNLMSQLPVFHDPLIRWYADEYTLDDQGKNVAFVVRNPADDMATKTNVDIYLVPTDNSEKPRLLTDGYDGIAGGPVFSLDGRCLAWLQMETPGYESDIKRIYIYDIETGTSSSIARDWDRSPDSLLWSADGQTLFALVPDQGNVILFAVDVSSGERKQMTTSGTILSIALAGQDRLVFQLTDQDKDTNLYAIDIETKEQRQLTKVNSDILKDVYVGDAEDFWFAGALDEQVHGWLIKPPSFDATKKYPLAYIIHGGPQGSNQKVFGFSIWDSNMYASAGFVTVMVNFHGSTGYGQKFTDSINRQWGGYPYEDLMKGLDYLLEAHSYIDPERMIALGASYGGYMINWLNGHTKRFRAMVAHDGEFNSFDDWYATDELWFPEYDLGGTPYDPKSRKNYEEFSPERFANEFSTPTLFIHGGKDYRLGIENSLGPFTLLRRKGIPARFIYFPDEGHWISKKGNEIKWFTETFRWIAEYTNTTLPYTLDTNS
ncbi:dipeptidylpeptidase [Coemansia erecta]|uniref:Dipeptidyl-peptidase V n=1 Tax=Coemansia erecta TaxID=147472 RepID=A0A9W7Y1C5_9FUNG|nr:dipeptidylpeptidase [Coemansia erecta]